METLYKYICYAFRILFFTFTNLYALPCYIVWMTLLTPVRFLAPATYWKMEAFMFKMLQTMVVTWIDTNGYKVLEYGDDISKLQDKGTIILCNHQSTADTPVLMLSSYGKGMASGNTFWIMYILFKYTNFGLVSMHRGDFFIDQGKNVRQFQLAKLKEHLLNSYLPHNRKWIIVFPEGGFLYKRIQASQEFARKYGHPVLQHTTLPRIGAMKTILDTVGVPYQPKEQNKDIDNDVNNYQLGDPSRPVKWVVDITIAYKDKQPLGMLGMCIGYNPRNDILLHYRVYRAEDIPRDEDGLTSWLYNLYSKKDAMLDYYYKEGRLPEDLLAEPSEFPQLEKSPLKFDLLQQILIHTFFITSCYVHYVYLVKPVVSIFSFFLSFVF